MNNNDISELSFEEKMDRLENITELMQQSDTSLKDSVSLFEEGSLLIKHLNEELEKIEDKIKILTRGKLEDFEE